MQAMKLQAVMNSEFTLLHTVPCKGCMKMAVELTIQVTQSKSMPGMSSISALLPEQRTLRDLCATMQAHAVQQGVDEMPSLHTICDWQGSSST